MKKTVLVTGASRGIGKKIASTFAKDNYNVCINYNNSVKEAIELENDLKNEGYSVISFKCNIANRVEVDNMVDFVLENFGTIDVLVNNAGIADYKLFTDITEEDMKNMIDTSLIGTFNVTQSVLKKFMINRKSGKIINISSIWGIVGASCEVHYSMVKSGIIGFTKALAKELGLSNITVNAVAPGVIDTDMMKDFSKEEINVIKEEIPLNRIGTVEDVASVVKFLASDSSSYITGQVISPNGGMVV
jgi:3-oxoacyl-[acyl-carrier protein] reductase